jgi:hypothetical protein
LQIPISRPADCKSAGAERAGGNGEKYQNLYRKGRNIAFSIEFFVTFATDKAFLLLSNA